MTRPSEELVVRAFNDAINRRDVAALGELMTDNHRFVDSAGATVEGKSACVAAWRGFFDEFPDYRNVFDVVASEGAGVVGVLGRSECSTPEFDGPARWRAVVVAGRLAEWRVFDDTSG